jgi:hypothetical protein
MMPFRNSRKLAQIIPDAQFAGLSACGHNPQVWLREVVVRFTCAVKARKAHGDMSSGFSACYA